LELLLADDQDGLKDLLHALFAGIPHQWYDNNPICRYEGYYASVFYSHFAALGLDIVLEDATNQGRIDMTVKLQDRVYLSSSRWWRALRKAAPCNSSRTRATPRNTAPPAGRFI
jgi:hypothetical protein